MADEDGIRDVGQAVLRAGRDWLLCRQLGKLGGGTAPTPTESPVPPDGGNKHLLTCDRRGTVTLMNCRCSGASMTAGPLGRCSSAANEMEEVA